jgi:Bacterial membrane protein YfhO
MLVPRLSRLLLPLSLLFTYCFFAEYLPPLRSVHIPYDLHGYHYPLNDYAFQEIARGRFPEWDPTIYCGMPFAGNLQTQSFYPPVWLLYLANLHRAKLTYLSLEIFVFLHVWLTFVLGYVWLHRRGLLPMAAVLGAGVLAYSGYLMLQLQHLGLVATYAWIPLGLWGIDEFVARRNLRSLWKLVTASALAFLAGYPPTWVVFAVCMVSYAVIGRRWNGKVTAGVVASLFVSLLLCMVQLLPAFEAAGMKEKTSHYGPGIVDPMFYLSYLVPNYFNFGLKAPIFANPGFEYLYLGAAGILGLVLAAGRQPKRELLPFLGVIATCLVAVTNPFNLVWTAIRHSSMVSELIRDWYFLAGVTVGIAGIAALGLDSYLRRDRKSRPIWMTVGAVLVGAGWAVAQLLLWLPKGTGVPSGWKSAVFPAVTILLLWPLLWMYRSAAGHLRLLLALAVVLTVAVDYKVFGTSLRMNAMAGDVDRFNRKFGIYPGMHEADYWEIRSHPEYRVIDDLGNTVLDMRHYGVTTPQGGDPLMPKQYRQVFGNVPGGGGHAGGPLPEIDAPNQKDLLRLLAVRYIVSFRDAPRYCRLASDPDFRRLSSTGNYFQVFEFLNAQPPYRWKEAASEGSIRPLVWKPERRELQLTSRKSGTLVFVEEDYPGWSAWVDGKQVPIDRWEGAFQSIQVAAGDHRVVFEFRSLSLRWGALMSAASILCMIVLFFRIRIRANVMHRTERRGKDHEVLTPQ